MNKESLLSTETVIEEKRRSKNPHKVSLGKFLQARATPISLGLLSRYKMLRNGQIIKTDRR